MAEAAMEDHIIIDRDTPFLLVLCMYPVDVMPTNFGVHENWHLQFHVGDSSRYLEVGMAAANYGFNK